MSEFTCCAAKVSSLIAMNESSEESLISDTSCPTSGGSVCRMACGMITYRYVIFPQAIRQTLPPQVGQLVSLIKDSSLLSFIAIKELTFAAQQVNTMTVSTLETYLPLAAGYLVLTIPISLWSRWLERRFQYET